MKPRVKRYDDGGAVSAPMYPFQPSTISPPGSTTTVNVTGASAPMGTSGGNMFDSLAQPMKKGGKVSASRRADGIAQRGKTKGKMY